MMWERERCRMSINKYFNRTGVSYFVFGAIAMGLQFAVSLVIGKFWPGALEYHWLIFLISFASMYLAAFPVCRLLMKRLPQKQLFQHDMRFKTWILLMSMALCLMFFGSIIGSIVDAIISGASGLTAGSDVSDLVLNNNLGIVLLVVVIIGPIVEEVLFRKILIDRLIVFGDKAAILISAIMFALFHGNFAQLFYAFGVGLLFGYVYVRTGKLKYSITMHISVNFLGGFMPALFVKLMDFSQIQYSIYSGELEEILNGIGVFLGLVVFELAMIGVAITGLVMLIRYRKRFTFKQGEMQLGVKAVLKNFVTNPGMILYLALCVFMFVINLWPY